MKEMSAEEESAIILTIQNKFPSAYALEWSVEDWGDILASFSYNKGKWAITKDYECVPYEEAIDMYRNKFSEDIGPINMRLSLDS